jgi:ADP-ribosylglycohydrolase
VPPNSQQADKERAVIGSLLGTAVGDALGLPYEGLSPRRAQRLFSRPIRPRFLLGRGVISDDTEHTCLVAQALLDAGTDVDEFAHQFSRRLRKWFWCGPAGIGLATLRACVKLSCGVSPNRSGVFSAGNGPAMRSAILGAVIDDLELLHQLVAASTRVTHTDPRAEYGALAVAVAARAARLPQLPTSSQFLDEMERLLSNDAASELIDTSRRAAASAARGESTPEFAASIGLGRGVSGYVNHTVPIVLHAWWRHPTDYRGAVESAILCGGDTDTTAAIVGGIVGTTVGKEGIPIDWLAGLRDWPRSREWMEGLANQLARYDAGTTSGTLTSLPTIGLVARNALFGAIVIVHVLRRLFPPY